MAIPPTTDGYKRRNIYLCRGCGRAVVSEDRDQGVTPFMIACYFPDCEEMATSLFYALTDHPAVRVSTVRIEWYKPGAAEIGGLKPGELAHVEKGGLLMRRVDGGQQ